MYVLFKVKDVVRIPPTYFDRDLKEAALEVLRDSYEGVIDKELGLILLVRNVKVEEEGTIIPGDGATYHIAEFEVLSYLPYLREVVEGEAVEVTDFGVFMSLGPVDGLIHKSQVLDDRISYDGRRGALIGQETKRILERGDVLRARITSVSSASSNKLMRIALTMRQPFLGKLEWIVEDLERIYGKR